jgi:hypothetical protein
VIDEHEALVELLLARENQRHLKKQRSRVTSQLISREVIKDLRVRENRVLRRIFGPKRHNVIGGWRKLHNEELRNLYCSPCIIRIIKSRGMRWAGHVAYMGKSVMHI